MPTLERPIENWHCPIIWRGNADRFTVSERVLDAPNYVVHRACRSQYVALSKVECPPVMLSRSVPIYPSNSGVVYERPIIASSVFHLTEQLEELVI